jgi:hypothetical protein
MESVIDIAPVASPVAAAAPVAPAPVAPVAPAAQAPQSSSLMGTLKNLNWVEVSFGILGSAALYFTIYYYRHNLNAQAGFKTDMQNKIDELQIKLSDVSSVLDNKNSSSPQVFI